MENPEMLPNLLTKETCVREKSWHVVVVVSTSEKERYQRWRDEGKWAAPGSEAILTHVLLFQWMPLLEIEGPACTIIVVQPAVRSIYYQETDNTPTACLRTLLNKSKLTTLPKLI